MAKRVGEEVRSEKLDLKQILLVPGPEEGVLEWAARHNGAEVDQYKILALICLV